MAPPTSPEMVPPYGMQTTYQYLDQTLDWLPLPSKITHDGKVGDERGPHVPTRLVFASYGVGGRPELVKALLEKDGTADVVVLREVSDEFLGVLLSSLRGSLYRFSTHGFVKRAGGGEATGDLLSMSGHMVVISSMPFTWRLIHGKINHNQHSDIGPACLTVEFLENPLVVVACAASRDDITATLDLLKTTDPRRPCVFAVDMGTSSPLSYGELTTESNASQSPSSSVETALAREGFFDTWLAARCRVGESSNLQNPMPLPLAQLDALGEGEQGVTFELNYPTGGSDGGKEGQARLLQRRDRIFARPQALLRVGGFNIFGPRKENLDGQGSGVRRGIRCLLEAAGQGNNTLGHVKDMGAAMLAKLHQHTQGTPPPLYDPTLLRKLITEVDGWPTTQQEQRRNAAFHLVEDMLRAALPGTEAGGGGGGGGTARWSRVVVVPVGSLGLGTWAPDSAVDCLCIGPYSPPTFRSLVLEHVRNADHEGIRLLRRVGIPAGTLLEFDVLGLKVNVSYCAAAAVTEIWPEAMKRPPSDEVFSSLSHQSLAALKPARDMYYMLRSIPDMAQFRTAHLFLRSWGRSRGVFSSRFGYFGGFSLGVMLAVVCKALALGRESAGAAAAGHSAPVSATHLVIAFFNHYANFDWNASTVLDLCFHHHRSAPSHPRASGEAMRILGWHEPTNLNAATAATRSSLKTISEELSRARALLREKTLAWEKLLGRGGGEAALEFLSRFGSYVRVDTGYWGSSGERGRLFSGWVQSRCAGLLFELDRGLPNLWVRMWPTRFVEPKPAKVDGTHPQNEGEDLHDHDQLGDTLIDHPGTGSILIGLEWAGAGPTKQDEEKLLEIFDRFERRIRQDHRFFDERVCFIGAAVVARSEVCHLEARVVASGSDGETLDEHNCDYGYELDAGLDEAGPPEGEREVVDLSSTEATSLTYQPPPLPHEQDDVQTPQDPKPPPPKLRSAIDVLNRIRWDGAMDARDYVVGFEDRFLGVVEKALSRWKSDQADEEFIPQHRIVYFRRTTDGVVVWDRRARRDGVFGRELTSRGP